MIIKTQGFTLIELMVVMAIISILVLLASPLFLGKTQKAQTIQKIHDIKAMESHIDRVMSVDEEKYDNFDDNVRDLNNFANKGYVYDKTGLIDKVNTTNSFKVVPNTEAKKINSHLKGTFYIDENGKAYYTENTFEQNPLSKIKNYAITYSKINSKNIENIKRYDLAILEPIGVNKEQLQEIQDSGTKTYGYQSIFEIAQDKLDKDGISLEESDYLYVNGEKQISPYFKQYYGDIREKGYRDALFESIETNVINKGFNGLFMDTLDDLETSPKLNEAMRKDSNDNIKEEITQAYIDFVRELNFRYPDLSIILNRAFNTYNSGLAEYLDGVMYENLDKRDFDNPDTSDFYYKSLVKPLNKTAKRTDGVILALAYRDRNQNYNLAKQFNWPYFHYDSTNNKNLNRKDDIQSVTIPKR